MLILSEPDLRQLLQMGEVIDAVERGFQMLARHQALAPERFHLSLPARQATFLEMPACAQHHSQIMLGTKIASVFPENPAQGLDLVQAVYLLLDGQTGKPLALMEGRYLTSIRTAATSAVATRLLATSG